MKIAIVINSSWNIYNFRLGLIQNLLNQGHNVICLAPEDSYSSKLIELGCNYENIFIDNRGINPLKDLSLVYSLHRLYKKYSPDVILHYTIKPNIYGSLAARMVGIPVINNVCGLGSGFMNGGLLTRIIKLLYKVSFRKAEKVFFQNTDDLSLFSAGKLINESKTDILPGSGVNTIYFSPGIKDPNDQFTFLVISRVIKDKGIQEYADAARILKAEYPNIRFQLLGQLDNHHRLGIDPDLVKSWVEEGIMEYLGTTNDVRPFIDNADCVALPSYREGTPRTLLEAAAMGKPLIATDTPGCNNIVRDHQNGYLCKPRDAKDLATKMKNIFSLEPQERQKMGEMSRVLATQSFEEKIVIEKYLTAIQEIS